MTRHGAEEAAIEACARAVDLRAELAGKRQRQRSRSTVKSLVLQRAAVSSELAIESVDRLRAAGHRESFGGKIGAAGRRGNQTGSREYDSRTQQNFIETHMRPQAPDRA